MVQTGAFCDLTLLLLSSCPINYSSFHLFAYSPQSFEDNSQEVSTNVGDKESSSEGSAVNEMARGFRDEEFTMHKVQDTPIARSKELNAHRSVWSSSASNGLASSLSTWFGSENCAAISPSSSSFLPYCGSQLTSSDTNISRDRPRYSDPTTRKMNSNNNSSSSRSSGSSSSSSIGVDGPCSSNEQREGRDGTALRTISSILWDAVARHVEKLSDTDMQLAGLV